MLALEKSKTSLFLKQLGNQFSRPKAIVVFSAHFDKPEDIIITSGKHPKTIHDFYGFPEPLYNMQYKAPGSPQLAKRIADLFNSQGIKAQLDSQQGWDHGLWIPLQLIYPAADIPVVEISINSRLGSKAHYQYGKVVSELREQQVMIIGSGGISHNLSEVFKPTATNQGTEKVQVFTHWVKDKLIHGDIASLLNYQNEAPQLRFNHPTQEHFMPIFAVLGSSDLQNIEQIHADIEYQVLAMDAYQFS